MLGEALGAAERANHGAAERPVKHAEAEKHPPTLREAVEAQACRVDGEDGAARDGTAELLRVGGEQLEVEKRDRRQDPQRRGPRSVEQGALGGVRLPPEPRAQPLRSKRVRQLAVALRRWNVLQQESREKLHRVVHAPPPAPAANLGRRPGRLEGERPEVSDARARHEPGEEGPPLQAPSSLHGP